MDCGGCPYHLTDPYWVDPPVCLADGNCIEEADMPEANNEQRVRINLAQGAKGDVKFEITSEFPDEDQAIEHLGKAIDKVKALCKEKDLKLADSAA